jgi:hypothetical protein
MNLGTLNRIRWMVQQAEDAVDQELWDEAAELLEEVAQRCDQAGTAGAYARGLRAKVAGRQRDLIGAFRWATAALRADASDPRYWTGQDTWAERLRLIVRDPHEDHDLRRTAYEMLTQHELAGLQEHLAFAELLRDAGRVTDYRQHRDALRVLYPRSRKVQSLDDVDGEQVD